MNHFETKRLAKLLSIVVIFQSDFPDWDESVKVSVKNNCQKEAERLKFPHGWQSIASYEEAKDWFTKNCIKQLT